MDDKRIVELFFSRSESAIKHTEQKYGAYCRAIAYNVLRNHSDAEECVNDAYLDLWNSIPPNSPKNLKSFVGVITRRIALDRYDYNKADKRSHTVGVAVDEFYECIPETEEGAMEEIIFCEMMNEFLSSLDKKSRIVFMQKYWYFCSVKEISDNLGLGESNVKVTLHRVRAKLRKFLEKEGVTV